MKEGRLCQCRTDDSTRETKAGGAEANSNDYRYQSKTKVATSMLDVGRLFACVSFDDSHSAFWTIVDCEKTEVPGGKRQVWGKSGEGCTHV